MSKRNRKNTVVVKKESPTMFIDKGGALLDIVIAVYNRFDLLKQCLDALPEAANGIAYNIIIVDNASTEDVNNFYGNIPPANNLFLIKNKENLGFTKASNQGARRKNSPYILMLNSDCILQPHAIEYMLQRFDDPKVGVVGLKLVFPANAEGLQQDTVHRPAGKIQHVGLETSIEADFFHIFLGWSADNPRANRDIHPYAVTGACLMTRRVIWNKVGGFFEGYGAGSWEDIDFCMSARSLDYDILLENRTYGVHYTGATAEKYNIAYPLSYNRSVFLSRWSNKLTYSEWSRY
jgi:GT2 family glycosyltransferase